ncbi:MAG: GNAT family N-acetyltransferase [Vicinamibacterales bacterium]
MNVVDFSPELQGEWDAFVARHPHAAYGHLSAQFGVAAETPGLRNVSLLVRDHRAVIAVLPLFVRERHALRVVRVRELTSGGIFPGGPLISPTLQGKAATAVLDVLLNTVAARAEVLKVDDVVITHPHVVGAQPSIVRFGYSPLLHYGYAARTGVGLLLDLSCSPDKLATGRRSGCRQSINKAYASGATVAIMADRAQWLACHELNVQTLGHLAYSERQMAAIWDGFIAAGHATAHATYVDGRVAAVTVTVHFNKSAYYWIGLNRRPLPLPGAGHLALWTAILHAQSQGCGHFELGSLDFENPKNQGISQFKQSFGGSAHQIVSAGFSVRPVRAAALALGEAIVAAARERGSPQPSAGPRRSKDPEPESSRSFSSVETQSHSDQAQHVRST